jgi:hypothetical protein
MILAGGRVGADLLCDTLVGVTEPVADDLAVDAQVASEGGISVAHIVQPDASLRETTF